MLVNIEHFEQAPDGTGLQNPRYQIGKLTALPLRKSRFKNGVTLGCGSQKVPIARSQKATVDVWLKSAKQSRSVALAWGLPGI